MKRIGNLQTIPALQPIITIDYETLERLKYFVQHAPQECQWWHRIKRVQMDDRPYVCYHLHDMLIPPQYCSAAEVESDPKMMQKMWMGLGKERDLGMQEVGDIMASTSCWCHSHVTGDVGPSPQDNTQWAKQKKLAKDGKQPGPQMMFITNKKNDYFCRIWDPELNVEFTNPSIEVLHKIDFSDLDEAVKTKLMKPPAPIRTVKKHQSTTKPVSTHNPPHNRSGSMYGYNDPADPDWWQRHWEDQQENQELPGKSQAEAHQASATSYEMKKVGSERLQTAANFFAKDQNTGLLTTTEIDELELLANEINGTSKISVLTPVIADVLYMVDDALDEEDYQPLQTLVFGDSAEIRDIARTIYEPTSSEEDFTARVQFAEALQSWEITPPVLLPMAIETTHELTTAAPEDISTILEGWIAISQKVYREHSRTNIRTDTRERA